MLALAFAATTATEIKAQETPLDTIGQPNSPDLGWEIIGDPIIDDIIIKRDLIVLPEAWHRENELCFVAPIDMTLPYLIYEGNVGNKVKDLGTLTLKAREEEYINISCLSAGPYLFVLKIGNSCYGCRFEVE